MREMTGIAKMRAEANLCLGDTSAKAGLLKAMDVYLKKGNQNDCNLAALKLEKRFNALQIKNFGTNKQRNSALPTVDKDIETLKNNIKKLDIGIEWMKYVNSANRLSNKFKKERVLVGEDVGWKY